jgi:dihydroneopterin aldolase
MSIDDLRAAFAHPLVRAEATAGAGPLDRISLRDHIREAEIGAFQAERGQRQRLRFDIVVEVARPGPAMDDVDRILSYDRLTEAIAAELAAERLNLLETLAERVAARILLQPQAARVFVRIEKLDRGPGALGVEIVRARGDGEPAATPIEEAAPRPRVVLIGNPALAHPALPLALDRLIAAGAPLILCVGLPAGPRPRAAAPLAQRRIDLLAIEQNAWVLAGRDRRCIVVGSRTELDWALRHGQVSVWAPSKIVLDAPEGPKGADGPRLAAWLAGLLGAVELRLLAAEEAAPPAAVPVARGSVEAPL